LYHLSSRRRTARCKSAAIEGESAHTLFGFAPALAAGALLVVLSPVHLIAVG
jgi:hypothetical protein